MFDGKKLFWVVFALVSLAFLPACGGGGGGGGSTPPPDDFVSIEPVANAGRDQDVKTGDLVQLDGSGSTNPEGGLLTYSWELSAPAGSTAALSDPTAIRPEFTADLGGVYLATLVVNDGKIDSDVDSVTITATSSTTNARPVANAGPDQNVTTGSLVTLDGRNSSDADGDGISFSWTLVAPTGSAAVLSDPTAVRPTFTADQAGDYLARLVVNDGQIDSAVDSVTITATTSTANARPVANAGPDQFVTVGDVVTLDGSGSSDADGDALTYSWSFVSPPEGSTAVLTGESTVAPSFTADRADDYVLKLVVNDGALSSVADTVVVESSYVPLFTMVGSHNATKSTDGIYYLRDSRFDATITNDSLLNFTITKAELFSGSIVLGSIEDPAVLGEILPNDFAAAGFTLEDGDVVDEGFEFRYYLIRPDTSETFVVKYLYD